MIQLRETQPLRNLALFSSSLSVRAIYAPRRAQRTRRVGRYNLTTVTAGTSTQANRALASTVPKFIHERVTTIVSPFSSCNNQFSATRSRGRDAGAAADRDPPMTESAVREAPPWLGPPSAVKV